jgi:hypothetical protein
MRDRLRELTSRSPEALGWERSRWTLALLRKQLGEKAQDIWMSKTESGTWQMLNRLDVTHTRGEGYALSPDEQFEAKRAFIEGVRMRSETEEPESEKSETEGPEGPDNPIETDDSGSAGSDSDQTDRLFYLDELTYELHPTIASEWSPAGKQPTRQRGTCGQKEGRLLAAMDAKSGRVFYRQKQSMERTDLTDLYREIVSAYEAERVWVVQDNAPFHFHADVFQKLERQVWPRSHPAFEYPLPSQWLDPTDAVLADGELPIQIVPLPTYASWLNPIERLWRWLKQEVLHLHPYAADWKKLKQGVRRSTDSSWKIPRKYNVGTY